MSLFYAEGPGGVVEHGATRKEANDRRLAAAGRICPDPLIGCQTDVHDHHEHRGDDGVIEDVYALLPIH